MVPYGQAVLPHVMDLNSAATTESRQNRFQRTHKKLFECKANIVVRTVRAKFRNVTKKSNSAHKMMLECHLKAVGRVLCLQSPAKALVNLHTAQDFVE